MMTAKQKIELEEEKMRKLAGSTWRPLAWRRADMMVVYLFMTSIMFVLLEFSYSHTYGDRQFEFLAAIKLLSIFLEIVISKVCSFVCMRCCSADLIITCFGALRAAHAR